MLKIKRALISVSDKTGLRDLVFTLNEFGVEIISTGGTASGIAELGIKVIPVSEYTGSEEMIDGRVKTLHPKIHSGILALRDNPLHMKELKDKGIGIIDMVVANLYPFEKVIQKEGLILTQAIENIDIGGPTMLRSAAKNYSSVAVVINPESYPRVIRELKENKGYVSEDLLKDLALEVFLRTAEYDKCIYSYLKGIFFQKEQKGFPQELSLSFKKIQDLRYGENPHQKAAFYFDNNDNLSGLNPLEKLQGKELSFNNILDMNSALGLIQEFKEPAVVIIKHNNPCGFAVDKDLATAFRKAWEGDPLSAFGSVIGLNRAVDIDTAQLIVKAGFTEAVLAPGFTQQALEAFKQKKNLRVLRMDDSGFTNKETADIKKVPGGLLLQDKDSEKFNYEKLEVVSKRLPAEEEKATLLFAWKVCKHVKSNAIVLAQKNFTVGIGAGQMSRVDSVIIACRKAENRAKGSVLASDAFFPKPDSIDVAYKAGVTAVIQPGGSIKDQEIIDACNKYNMAMLFTGMRHFRH